MGSTGNNKVFRIGDINFKMTKGFTLLETLVTILIFSFIIGGIYGVMNIANINYDTKLVSLNLQRQARQGMSRLSREARQASWISIVLGSLDENGIYHSITFNTPDATGVNYSLVSGQLQRIDSAHTVPKIIANDMTVPIFSMESLGHILNIQVQASKTFRSFGQERTLTFSLTEQVQIRNP